ncbi:DEAD/DEAH box helicase [Tuwongella immobilis]|uniref:Helicase ATP-binding domain-containing protein n=1 Tax=Tuwongella immobilis TaxID=692036 RepID=A0A6C2YNS2_9BACT|nr:DEAD/DEAH box helicase [Tuwongella immobilis]VIP03086.1 type iii restriction protein res subunit : Type III restriction protein res subunit OS=Isosphaera pallida (strain ATCC 43644 / DSM 9630 / IS1B) GN=Isop_2443 PE=4 SV=1: ResIII: Helicase_C: UPF0547 [Tuwongella immobilis]VTS03345.1 type iii restriction protein res subunit : Type III restriction protein res subunit OS=Isosphaera pallida (strain ATCC 43644 / DSM 9630 / IS1B) GN=Isop_2443 PE=4 SV=1: ResIII: Helicase_C: UPF0547 [Tuwongella immob
MNLRDYQQHAVDAVYDHLRKRDDNPCVVIPTGGGKTPVIATLCRDAVTQWNGRVLVLAHVKELLQQTAEKLGSVCPDVPFGVFSAGLKRKDRNQPVLIAGIQSIYRFACDFEPFDLIIVDEAHLIPLEGDGMYRRFLADAKVVNPHLRVIGCTATPFRLKGGPICTPEGMLNHVCYEVGVRELIVRGFLCPLTSKAGRTKFDVSQVGIHKGEYCNDELEQVMDAEDLVKSACREIVELTADRYACLIFATSVQHGLHIVNTLQAEHGVNCGFITGETPPEQREQILSHFKQGRIKYLCNVNVLTTGFDAPNIDCVVLLRPTLSSGLYYQMVGRGFRLHESKQNCLILDYGGNVLRHGPVDRIRTKTTRKSNREKGEAPAKECPECSTLLPTAYAACPDCGHEFPPPDKASHDATASKVGVLSGQVSTESFNVISVIYSVHSKRHSEARSLRVDYKIGWQRFQSEWICFEHTGFAHQKAVRWWKQRSRLPVPQTAREAWDIAMSGGVASPTAITVRTVSGEKFDTIVGYQLGKIPDGMSAPTESIIEEPGDAYEPESTSDVEFPFGMTESDAIANEPWWQHDIRVGIPFEKTEPDAAACPGCGLTTRHWIRGVGELQSSVECCNGCGALIRVLTPNEAEQVWPLDDDRSWENTVPW